jgi:hypothetical protein
LEEVEVEEVLAAGEVAALEVSFSISLECDWKLTRIAGRGGFQQRDNGPPAEVLGKE